MLDTRQVNVKQVIRSAWDIGNTVPAYEKWQLTVETVSLLMEINSASCGNSQALVDMSVITQLQYLEGYKTFRFSFRNSGS